MNRTKTRLYASIMALALVGLLLDRFVIGDPRDAGAAQSDLVYDADPGANHPLSPSPQALLPEPFPAGLQPVEQVGGLRDPFQLPAELLRIREQRLLGNRSNAPVAAGRRRGQPLTIEQFSRAHHLTGVSVVGKTAMAIVDGRIVEIGQEVDHSRLLTIEGNRAFFKCADGIAVLVVDNRD